MIKLQDKNWVMINENLLNNQVESSLIKRYNKDIVIVVKCSYYPWKARALFSTDTVAFTADSCISCYLGQPGIWLRLFSRFLFISPVAPTLLYEYEDV